jgi:hypothetical protein
MRKFGLAIDALRSCDVVTADGEFVVGWAATSASSQTSRSSCSRSARMAWPMDDAHHVLRFLREFIADAPDEVGVMANLLGATAASRARGPSRQADRGADCHLRRTGRRGSRGAPIQELSTPAFDALMPKPYVAHQKMFDAVLPHGRHYCWKSHRLGPLTDEIIDVVVDQAAQMTSPLSTVPIFCFGGPVARVPEESTAFPYRDAAHDINIVASWLPEAVDDADHHIEWVRGFFHALEPHSRGVYVNFTSDDAVERVRDASTEQQWARLTPSRRSTIRRTSSG